MDKNLACHEIAMYVVKEYVSEHEYDSIDSEIGDMVRQYKSFYRKASAAYDSDLKKAKIIN